MKQHLNTLYVTTDGTWLALDGETVTVSLHGQRLIRVPLINLEGIQTFGWDISASPQLMAYCSERGVQISFCSPTGHFLCRVCGFSKGNVLLRRRQYRLADNVEQSLAIAREMIAAKILNSRIVLQRSIRDSKVGVPDTVRQAVRSLSRRVEMARCAETAEVLLGIEGNAAEIYFHSLPNLLTTGEFSFHHRNRRPPKDPVNALLSFCYHLLASDCKSAAEAVGLDCAVGFYHKERPGRPSLALDLMEELRAPLAERMTLTLLNRRQLDKNDFSQDTAGGVRLSDEARKKVLVAWQERKKQILIHPYLKERITIGLIPHIQARLLAQYVRGGIDAYPPMFWH